MKTKTIGYLSLISCIVSTILMTFFEITSSYFPTRLNQKSFNASMTEQSVQTLYDNLIDDQSEVVLNNYSTIYFSHLNNNFPINSHGTCSYVGISMLLSFFDSYWDDEFIDESFEQTASFQSTKTTTQNLDIPSFDTESPGIVSEDWDDVEDLTLAQYQNFILTTQNIYLQSYLIELEREMVGSYYFDSSTNPYGMSLYEQTSLITYYLMYIRSIYNSRSFVTSCDYPESLEEYIVSKLLDGVPVMINALTSVGYHSMIAYDYDASSETIYVHTGWKDTNGKALSHVSIDQLGVSLTSIDSALSIDPTSNVEHEYDSPNYVSSSNTSYCSCQMVYPRNIIMTSGNYVDINPSFKWDSLYEEKWFREYNPYIEFSILNQNQTVIFTKNIYSGNEYTLKNEEWHKLNTIDTYTDYHVRIKLSSRSYSFSNNYCLQRFDKILVAPDIPVPYYSQNNFTSNFFKNCGNNIIENSIGNCGFTAISMLLTYYDTYWSDKFIPERYESSAIILTENNDYATNYDSPGIINNFIFNYSASNLTEDKKSTEIHAFIKNAIENKNTSFFGLLLYYAVNRGHYSDNQKLSSIGVGYELMVDVLDAYRVGNSSISSRISLVSEQLSDYNDDETALRNAIIVQLRKGNPVIVGGNCHVFVAYEYDEINDIIYGNMGWGRGSTHYDIADYLEDNPIADYYYYQFLDDLPHTHSLHYYNSTTSQYLCSCELSSHKHCYQYLNHDDNHHYRKCICMDSSSLANHFFTSSYWFNGKEYSVCGGCGYSKINTGPIPGV